MKFLKTFFFNISILLALLLMIEIALRKFAPDYQYYYRTHEQQPNFDALIAKSDTNWLQADEDLGWVCQQKEILKFPSPPVEGVVYQINEQGFRNSFSFRDTFPPNKKRVLLIGDSFLFSIYLPEGETTTTCLQNQKGCDHIFFNLSVPAWGIDQMYLAYQKYVDLIKPDQVIFVFVDEDYLRSMDALFYGCGRKPNFKIENKKLIPNQDPPMLWEHLCWHNQVGNRFLKSYYQRKAVTLTAFMFEQIIDQEKSLGRSPSFIRIPALVDLENKVPRRIFSMTELMQQKELDYLELYDTLAQLPPEVYRSYYIPDDGHLTKDGAAMLADYLLEWIE